MAGTGGGAVEGPCGAGLPPGAGASGLTRTARAAAAVIALAAWGGVLAGCVGVFGRTGSVAATLWIMSAYFTNTTGLLVALLFTGRALGLAAFARPPLFAAASLMMLLVGIVQHLLLQGPRTLTGADALADDLLHTVLPLLVPAFWLAFARKGALRARDPLLWTAYPLGYLAWALARGAAWGRAIYPFLDRDRLGGLGVLAHVAAITAGFLAFGLLIVGLDARLARRGATGR